MADMSGMDATLPAPSKGRQEIPEEIAAQLSSEERLTARRCLMLLGSLAGKKSCSLGHCLGEALVVHTFVGLRLRGVPEIRLGYGDDRKRLQSTRRQAR